MIALNSSLYAVSGMHAATWCPVDVCTTQRENVSKTDHQQNKHEKKKTRKKRRKKLKKEQKSKQSTILKTETNKQEE
jgi:hypothetical protein